MVGIESPFDYNRDGRQNAADSAIALSRLGIVPGDLDANDRFGVRDLVLWRSGWVSASADGLRRSDLDGDGRLTRLDLAFASFDYGQIAHPTTVARRLRLIQPAPVAPSPPGALTATVGAVIRGRRGDAAADTATLSAEFDALGGNMAQQRGLRTGIIRRR
jgi:hypothetical protein